MKKSLRLMMIKSAHERVQMKRRQALAEKLFEREVDKIEEEYQCSALRKNSRTE